MKRRIEKNQRSQRQATLLWYLYPLPKVLCWIPRPVLLGLLMRAGNDPRVNEVMRRINK